MEFKSNLNEVQATYVRTDQKNQKIQSSKSAYDLLKNVFPIDLDLREAFICLYLNRANNTCGYTVISIGGVSGTVCDPKTVFQHGLLANASSIILAHNHPSGNLEPSQADINLTNKLVKIGKELDMPILDHLILTSEDYKSFADSGLL
jgi:DNA repair protein RadC